MEHNENKSFHPYLQDNPPDSEPNSTADQPARKTRRVGTITMALALIAVGALLTLCAIFPQMSIVTVARFSPIILVALGIEILLSSTLSRGVHLKYDWLSVVFTLLLIGGSLLFTVTAEFTTWYYQQQTATNQLESSLTEQATEQLNALGYKVNDVQWHLSLFIPPFEGANMDEAAMDSYINHRALTIDLDETFSDEDAFAEAALQIIHNLQTTHNAVDSLSLNAFNFNESELVPGDQWFMLTISEPLKKTALSKNDVINQLEVHYWTADGYYDGLEIDSDEENIDSAVSAVANKAVFVPTT